MAWAFFFRMFPPSEAGKEKDTHIKGDNGKSY